MLVSIEVILCLLFTCDMKSAKLAFSDFDNLKEDNQ